LTFKVTTVRLSKEVLRELEELSRRLSRDRSDLLREAVKLGVRELKLRLALELYSKGKISLERMGELTGLDYREVFQELKRRNIPVRYGEVRFLKEIEEILS
jgi:predicted HTH domain antitoxin